MEHKLQIEFIHSTKGKIFFGKKNIVQTKVFKFGVKIKNIGKNPSSSATIKNIVIKSADGKDISETITKTFHVDTINPGKEVEIWVEEMGTYMHGLANIQLIIQPDNNDTIKTFQKNPFTKEVEEDRINAWINFFYIYSKNENSQSVNNTLLIWLTSFMAITMILNLYFVYQSQVLPIIHERERSIKKIDDFCNSPGAQSIGNINCAEYLELKS